MDSRAEPLALDVTDGAPIELASGCRRFVQGDRSADAGPGGLAILLPGQGRSTQAVGVRSRRPTGPGHIPMSVDEAPFEPSDTLLLYTDGVIEARDRAGDFYPLTQRAAHWADSPPGVLLHHIRHDLLAHAGGRLDDDAALIALHHTPARQARHAKTTPHDRRALTPHATPAKRRMTSPPPVR